MSSADVTVEDIEDRWRPLTDDETARAEALIPDALDIIGLAAVGEPSEATVRRICCAMVIRAMSPGVDSPMGVTTASWGASPYSGSASYSGPSGELFLTAKDKRDLGAGRGRIGFAQMGGDGDV